MQTVLSVGRRDVLKVGAVASVAALAAPSDVKALVSPQDPAGFAARYLTQRARCATGASTVDLGRLFSEARGPAAVFERERAAAVRSLGGDWDGVLHGVSSTVTSLSVTRLPGGSATIRAYEWTTIRWTPRPRRRSAADLAWRAKDPAKFGLDITPGGQTTSGVGTYHELLLEPAGDTWRIVADGYDEPLFLGASPDLTAGSWAALNGSRRPNSALRAPASLDVMADDAATLAAASGTYDYAAACTYAKNHAYYSKGQYNANYCNYNPCGGDCANFVSQCFRAGKHPADSTWKTVSGACGTCGTSSSNAGSTAWVNNWSLRNWVINSHRGTAVSGVGQLGYGDIINYDWSSGGSSFDHVAIVTDPVNDLVSAHNGDHYNVAWTLGGASAYRYTYMWLYWPA